MSVQRSVFCDENVPPISATVAVTTESAGRTRVHGYLHNSVMSFVIDAHVIDVPLTAGASTSAGVPCRWLLSSSAVSQPR